MVDAVVVVVVVVANTIAKFVVRVADAILVRVRKLVMVCRSPLMMMIGQVWWIP